MAINVVSIDRFKFICHKVMPLVYDESLSYYEFLCKVMKKLNEVIDSIDNQNETLQAFDNEINGWETRTDEKYETFVTNVNNMIEQFETQLTQDMDAKWDDFFNNYIQTLGVVQRTGDSEIYVMSQKGVTDELDIVKGYLEESDNEIGSLDIAETHVIEDTTFDYKIQYNFKKGVRYRIRINNPEVHWKSNNSQFIGIATYSANSISSTYLVDTIRLATDELDYAYGSVLLIDYTPTTDTSVMMGFRYYLGEGDSYSDVNVYEIYSKIQEDVHKLNAESVNIRPEVEKSENQFSGTISSSPISIMIHYHFIKDRTYKLYLDCILGTESTTNVLRVYTATAANVSTTYRADVINASTVLSPLCGQVNDFATGDEIAESFTATKTASHLIIQYYGTANTNYEIDVDIVRIASVEEIDKYEVGNSVVALNKDVEPLVLQLKRQISNRTVTHNFDRLNFIFFSDIHARGELWERVCDYMDEYSDIIPFAIHGGDYVSNDLAPSSIVDLYALRKPKNGAILNTVGNHDCYPSGSSSPTANAETVYGVLYNSVNPVEDGWNCTFGVEQYAMYWYKDIADAGVRIICLDRYHWDNTQKTWFINALDDAKTAEYGVITVVHTPITTNVTDVGSGFWTLDNWVVNDTYTGAMVDIREAIDDFVTGGGVFIIHLCGHIHSDQFGETDTDELLQFRTQMAGYSELWTDTVREYGSKTYDCFNVIQIDRNLGMIKMIRIGCNSSDCLQPRTTLCYDYVNKQLISNT